MPSIFIKDDLRAAVEAATGGRVTVLYTASGQPSYMNVIPRFNLQDVDPALGTGTPPAFIVNGVEKPEIFIGAYQGIRKNGELLSIPGVNPTTSRIHDNFVTDAKACGAGWHLMTNAEWAAIQLWCWKNGFLPRGNTNYGQSSDYPAEVGRRVDGKSPGDTGAGSAQTLTGSGPASWRHDNTNTGISDLAGNVWEWSIGLRVVGGEIQVIENNNASLNSVDLSATSTSWKAINGATGALVTPTFTGSIANNNYVATTANSVRYATVGNAPYTLVRGSGSTFEGMSNPGTTPVSAEAIRVLKCLGLFPVASSNLGGDNFYTDPTGERMAVRGGYWIYGSGSGIFTLGLTNLRTSGGSSIGARPAFIL